jgi:hypothetical protein
MGVGRKRIGLLLLVEVGECKAVGQLEGEPEVVGDRRRYSSTSAGSGSLTSPPPNSDQNHWSISTVS